MILSNFLWVPHRLISDPDKLKNELTVWPKFDKEPVETFVETDVLFGIPRNFYPIPEKAEDFRIAPKKVNTVFKGELRQVQQNIINDWKALRRKGIDDWIIKADTGVGKTIIMIKMACDLKMPFLVIVPLERLMTYWVDQIKKFSNITDVGIIQQNRCEYDGQLACVGMVHSLSKDKYPDEMKNHFGTIIYDELQKYASDQFSKVVSMFASKHRIGASATLDRQDGLENVYYYHLGKNIITTEKKTQPNPKVFKYEYNVLSGRYPKWLDKNDRVKCRAMLLSMLAKNDDRNSKIAQFAKTLVDKGMQTLVIGDRIDQLVRIQKEMIKMGCEGTGLYIGKTPEAEKRRLEKEATCILATMKMLEVGIDIDTLRGLIFATPKSDVKQVVGRIRRINPKVLDPVVIDIVDIAHKETIRWYDSRASWYNEEKFYIRTIEE
jgi:superfamily II DNA or RNA helicase